MRHFILTALLMAVALPGMTQDRDTETQITQALDQFLHGASVNDAQVHENFWAEELVYTSSSGERFGKEQLMNGVTQGTTIEADEVSVWYSAEDVQMNPVGDAVILSFTLVATPANDAQSATARFLNTGVMVERDGRWQALSWNATRKADD